MLPNTTYIILHTTQHITNMTTVNFSPIKDSHQQVHHMTSVSEEEENAHKHAIKHTQHTLALNV